MMSERYENESLEHLINRRLRYAQQHLAGTLTAMLDLKLIECNEAENTFVYIGKTAPWMINFHGTLHGGMGATLVDQAMGHTAFCLKQGPGITPTIDMDVKYHRPLMADEDVLMRVHLISRTKTLMYISCEAYRASMPDKICVTATATYFYKADGKHL